MGTAGLTVEHNGEIREPSDLLRTAEEDRTSSPEHFAAGEHQERTAEFPRSRAAVQVSVWDGRVNARTFEPFLYHYGLKCGDRRGETYAGFLGRTPVLSSGSIMTEGDPSIRTMAEEMAREILEIIENRRKLIVTELTLTFAMERSNEPQLWLLGASLFRFIPRGRQAKRRRVNIRLDSVDRPLASRKFTDYLPVTTKLPPALRRMGRIRPTAKREKHFSFNSTAIGGLLKEATSAKEPRTTAKEDIASQTAKRVPLKARLSNMHTKYSSCNKSPQVKINELLNKSYNQFKFFQNNGFETVCNYSKTGYSELQYISLAQPNGKVVQLNSASVNSSKEIVSPKQAVKYVSAYSPLSLQHKKGPCAGDFCRSSDIHEAFYPIDELFIVLGRTKPFSIQGMMGRQIFPLKAGNSANKLARHTAHSKTDAETDTARSHKDTAEDIFLARVSKAFREQLSNGSHWVSSLPACSLELVGRCRTRHVCRRCKTVYTKIARTLSRQLLGLSC